MIDFFSMWVEQLWGSEILSLIGTGAIFFFTALLGRMGWQATALLMSLYFVTFSVGFYGMAAYLPIIIMSALYFTLNLMSFIKRK